MRRSSVVLLALTAGLTASAALRRVVARRGSATAVAVPMAPAVRALASADAVVLPFTRRVVAEPVAVQAVAVSAAAFRCGDSGGRTKAGAPCAARATPSGRCHHHRLAA
jgi:hypothetical protein